MATLHIPGRSVLDMDTRKITGIAGDVNDDSSAVNYAQIKDLGAIPTVTDLATTTGTLGELVQLTQQDHDAANVVMIIGTYVRVGNQTDSSAFDLKHNWRDISEQITGEVLPTTNLWELRPFYLDAHQNGDDAGWYLYHTQDTGRPADWYESGINTEAEREYPDVGTSAANTPYVEPFHITPGFWNFESQLYIYTGVPHNVNHATDAFNNAPIIQSGPNAGNLSSGWQLWDTFVASKQDDLPFLGTFHLWTGAGADVPVAVSVDTLGYTRREDATHEFATRNAFETDSTREYDEGEIYYVIDYDGAGTPAAFEVTTPGTGYGTGTILDGDNTARFATRTLDTPRIQNIVENGSSTTRGAAGAWPTTESWQRAHFAPIGTVSSGDSDVTVNSGAVIATPNFTTDTATTPTGFDYSPPFQQDTNDVSVQIDTRVIGNALGINSLKAQVHQIEEELSQPGSYTWVDEQVFVDVFITNRVNSSGTLNQTTILQPHFEDNSNIFTTYALLTGDDDTGLRNQWNGFNSNAAGIIVGLGPDDTDLVAFQLLSTYYRDSTAAGLAEIRLKMIDPDGAFAGPSRVGSNTNKQQFISWISDNDNPITTADPNPVIHQGISTYYYETDNDFLDTVRHDVGSHITGSALTADERVVVDNLTANNPTFDGNLGITGGLIVDGGNNNDIRFNHSIEVRETNNNATANPSISINRRSNSPLAGDDIGLVEFKGTTTDGTDETDDTNYAVLGGDIVSESTALPVGQLYIKVADGTAATTNQAKHITVNGKATGGATVNLANDTDLDVGGTVNDANANAAAYVAIQFTAGIPTDITSQVTNPVTGFIYLQYTANYKGNASNTLVDVINTTTGATITYDEFVLATKTGDIVPQS